MYLLTRYAYECVFFFFVAGKLPSRAIQLGRGSAPGPPFFLTAGRCSWLRISGLPSLVVGQRLDHSFASRGGEMLLAAAFLAG